MTQTRTLVMLFVLCSALSAGAEAPRWVQAETEHFRFIFEPQDRAAADELLTFSEPIYEKITGFFHTYPKKIDVILHGRVDEANGATAFLPNRIDLFLTAPTDHFLGARTESWMKILLTHELTHFVHASMDSGFFFTLSRLFGGDLAASSLFFLPGWMIEGPSTNLETRFTEGGRGRNPLFEMYAKAPVQEGRLFSLEQAAYSSAFPPPDRIYVAGYILVDYLLTTYGVDTFRRIMEEYLGFPFLGPWGAIQKVTGRSATQVFEDLRHYLSNKYAPSLSAAQGTRVTPKEPGDWIHPQLTDRGVYVYHASPYRFPAIVRYDPTNGSEHVLHSVVNDGVSFSATRDGRRVYYSSLSQTWADPATPEVVSDLYSTDVDTGVTKRITRGAHIWQPAVSPDGSALIVVQGTGPYSRLVSVDVRTGALRVLYARSEGNVYTPAFSPDGRRVAFTVNLRGYQDVYVAELAALLQSSAALENPRLPIADTNVEAARPVLGPDPFGDYYPSFFDSDTVLFSSDRGSALALYKANLGTGPVVRIQEDPVAAIAGVPDGENILYSSYSADGWCLKTAPISALAATAVPPEQIEALGYPPAFEWTGRSVEEKPYTDVPAPLLWLPYPTLTRTGPASPGVEIGLGAVVYGASLLGRSTWLADAAWSFGSQQPLADLSVSTVAGPFTLSADSTLAYQYSDDYTQSVVSTLFLGLPVFRESAFDTQRALTLTAGIGHSAKIESLVPFTFAQSIGPLAGAWQNRLFATSGVSFQWTRSGGQIDFTPPLAFSVSLQNATYLPALDYPAPESDFFLNVGLNIPSFIPHQVVRLGLKATDVVGGPFTSYTDSFSSPRGFPGSTTRSVSGQALASFDYIASIALLDQPLFLGIAATGAALGVHVEGIGQWDDARQALSIDPSLYVGGDLTIHMAFNAVPFALTIGAAARIDTSAAHAFDPAQDLGIYFFLGQGNSAGLKGALPVSASR